MTQVDPNSGGWLVHDRGQQTGPYSDANLAALHANGTISLAALVWRAGMAQWAPIASLYPTRPPPPGAAPATYQLAPAHLAQANSNKVAAGICAILLGSLGIHKFILGFTTAGVITLCITFLTCGIGGLVMNIIGIIEGIIYLTKSDEEFYQRYVVQRKEWF